MFETSPQHKGNRFAAQRVDFARIRQNSLFIRRKAFHKRFKLKQLERLRRLPLIQLASVGNGRDNLAVSALHDGVGCGYNGIASSAVDCGLDVLFDNAMGHDGLTASCVTMMLLSSTAWFSHRYEMALRTVSFLVDPPAMTATSWQQSGQ